MGLIFNDLDDLRRKENILRMAVKCFVIKVDWERDGPGLSSKEGGPTGRQLGHEARRAPGDRLVGDEVDSVGAYIYCPLPGIVGEVEGGKRNASRRCMVPPYHLATVPRTHTHNQVTSCQATIYSKAAAASVMMVERANHNVMDAVLQIHGPVQAS